MEPWKVGHRCWLPWAGVILLKASALQPFSVVEQLKGRHFPCMWICPVTATELTNSFGRTHVPVTLLKEDRMGRTLATVWLDHRLPRLD